MTTNKLTDPTTGVTTMTAWAVRIRRPDGREEMDRCDNLLYAVGNCLTINRAFPGTGVVVYRDEEYGPWTDDLDGDEYGVKYEWPNGRTEVESRGSRADAESSTRLRNHGTEGARARRCPVA